MDNILLKESCDYLKINIIFREESSNRGEGKQKHPTPSSLGAPTLQSNKEDM